MIMAISPAYERYPRLITCRWLGEVYYCGHTRPRPTSQGLNLKHETKQVTSYISICGISR